MHVCVCVCVCVCVWVCARVRVCVRACALADRPQRVSCHFLKDKLELNIRWRPPWNIFFLLHHATLSLEEVASPEKWGAWYEVVVQGGGGPKYKPFQTQATEFLVDISDVAAKPEDIVVWVRVGTSKDSGKGPFSAAAHCT